MSRSIFCVGILDELWHRHRRVSCLCCGEDAAVVVYLLTWMPHSSIVRSAEVDRYSCVQIAIEARLVVASVFRLAWMPLSDINWRDLIRHTSHRKG